MATQKDVTQLPLSKANKTNNNFQLSVDWWAVLFALALVALVVAGLQVAW